MDAPKDVLIVGGGIGGMCAAICLARAGADILMVEVDPSWRALGAGLTMNGASLRALRDVGVLDEVLREGFGAPAGSRAYSADGVLLSESGPSRPFGPDIPVIGGILRPKLHKILQDAVKRAGIAVRVGVTVEGLTQDADKAHVRFTDATTGSYDLVLGADGLFSKTRGMIFPHAPAPAFTGQGCWRAVVPRPPEVVTPGVFLGAVSKAGFNPVSQGQMYLYLLTPEPDNRWMAPEIWLQELKDQLKDFGGYIADIRDGLSSDSQINYRPLEALMMPSPWYAGRVLLIGDAAHATTPHVGYGAGLAIEDGVVLGELSAQGLPLEDLLARFMERRFERCRAVVEGSVALGAMELAQASAAEQQDAIGKLMAVVRSPI